MREPEMDENDSHLHAKYLADPLGEQVLNAATEQT
jgi:hypothetical protein